MKKEYSFTLKEIVITGVIAFVLFLAFGGICLSVGHDHGYDDGYSIGYDDAELEFNDPGCWIPVEEGIENDDSEPLVYHVATENDPLNLREEPLQDSESLEQIPRGTNIDIYEINDHWGFTEYNGTEGWVNLEYCEEGIADPDDFAEDADMVWIVTTDGSYAYHKEYCQYVQRDDIRCVTESEAQSMGRSPCKKCGG